MRNHALNRRRRDLLTGFLLAMLLFRAYVPVGFMPASGTAFLVELCPAVAALPASMPMPMPAHDHEHHRHSDNHSHFENCPFGSATAAGPAPIFGAVNPLPRADQQSVAATGPVPVDRGRTFLPQPRGPPHPA